MNSPVYTPGGQVFGGRAIREEQRRILEDALASLRPPHATAVFDLDSTLLNNKPRQSRIVRETSRGRYLSAAGFSEDQGQKTLYLEFGAYVAAMPIFVTSLASMLALCGGESRHPENASASV